jgi:spore coat polysaccharide biosynthesis predicted glycosyltransferase SpsG
VATILLHAEGDARTGLGHLVRMVAVAGELAGEHSVHLASASPHLHAVVSELSPWSAAAFSLHELPPSDVMPWDRGEALSADLAALVGTLDAALLVSDGKASYGTRAFEGVRGAGKARVVLVDNVHAARDCFDVLVLPTCHADPAIVAAVGEARVRTGPAWTFLHPAVKALRDAPRGERRGVFVSMGGADPNGLTLRALEHLLAQSSEPIVAVVGPANRHRASIQALAAEAPRVRLVSGSPASQEALASSNHALCAFGITAYEAIALGVPLVVVPHDERVDGDMERFAAAFAGVTRIEAEPELARAWPAQAGRRVPELGALAQGLRSLTA